MNTYEQFNVYFVKGNGCWLTDENGKNYLDFFSGIAVNSLGHNHPAIVDAITKQARKVIHLSNIYPNQNAILVAEMINKLINIDENGKLFFCNSGAEAVECAIKLVKATKKEGIIVSCVNSFHGRTIGALSITGQGKKTDKFKPLLPNIEFVTYSDTNELKKIFSQDVSAVFVEPIQGEGGVIEPDENYLKQVYELCQKHNALMVVDEIQTGLGRCGKWFCFQYDDIKPDIITVAKALGNGFPVGACWAKEVVAKNFYPGDHGSTFGGQPLQMAVAKATIETLVDLNAPEKALTQGEFLKDELLKLDGVAGVSGKGLLLGVKLEKPIAKNLSKALLEKGLLVNAVKEDIIRIAPPLIISKNEIDHGISCLKEALKELK